MDPLRRPAAVMPIVSAVAVGVVVPAVMGVVRVVGGVSSAGAPRGPQHLGMKEQS